MSKVNYEFKLAAPLKKSYKARSFAGSIFLDKDISSLTSVIIFHEKGRITTPVIARPVL